MPYFIVEELTGGLWNSVSVDEFPYATRDEAMNVAAARQVAWERDDALRTARLVSLQEAAARARQAHPEAAVSSFAGIDLGFRIVEARDVIEADLLVYRPGSEDTPFTWLQR